MVDFQHIVGVGTFVSSLAALVIASQAVPYVGELIVAVLLAAFMMDNVEFEQEEVSRIAETTEEDPRD